MTTEECCNDQNGSLGSLNSISFYGILLRIALRDDNRLTTMKEKPTSRRLKCTMGKILHKKNILQSVSEDVIEDKEKLERKTRLPLLTWKSLGTSWPD